MRCTEHPFGGINYTDGSEVLLCQRHVKELEKYYTKNPPTEQSENTDLVPTLPDDGSLENILVNNLHVQSGAIQAREETAHQVYDVALEMLVTNIESRDRADELLGLVHQEEKAIKKERDAMYAPVKDAAKATRERLDSWFGPTLEFYAEAKSALQDKIGTFIRAEKAKEDVALATGDHETAAQCATEASENISLKRTYNYHIPDFNAVPLELMIPNPSRNDEIVKLLPREMLIPNYDLIRAAVTEHGDQLEIPGVKIILDETVQMRKGRKAAK
jgi:hypothetical protein